MSITELRRFLKVTLDRRLDRESGLDQTTRKEIERRFRRGLSTEIVSGLRTLPVRREHAAPTLRMVLARLVDTFVDQWVRPRPPAKPRIEPLRTELLRLVAAAAEVRRSARKLLDADAVETLGLAVRALARLDALDAAARDFEEWQTESDMLRPRSVRDDLSEEINRRGERINPHTQFALLLDAYIDLSVAGRDRAIAAVLSAFFKPQTERQVRDLLRRHRARRIPQAT